VNEIYLPDIVGGGYRDFWNFKGRYRVVKGSRASKKSKTTALNFIWRLITMPETNLLVVRKTYRSLKNSCFAELRWAIERLGVAADWQLREELLEMTYLPTGQKIYFRGLDDPHKITSIVAAHGYLCFLWIEEAFEVTSEEAFNVLDESIRGGFGDSVEAVDVAGSGDVKSLADSEDSVNVKDSGESTGARNAKNGLFKQVTLTFNPWNEHHWLKRRFFDCPPSEDILAKTVNYKCNEFLDEADLRVFERMAVQDPARYRVAGLGEWGVSEGLVYNSWRECDFDVAEVAARPGVCSVFGLDFGYVNDETALFCGLVDEAAKRLYVFDELYRKGLSNEQIYEEICRMGYAKEKIRADSAEPKSIDRLRELGLRRICAARKGKDSILNGIDYLQGFEILVLPKCRNFLAEIGGYVWLQDREGRYTNYPSGERNHLMDAMRYAMEGVYQGTAFSF
jgi:phage terminase large subunit